MKNWKKYFLPPVLIYVTIFMFISFLIGLKIDNTATWVYLVSLVITVYGLFLGTNYLKTKSVKEVFNFSLVWLIVLVLLDMLLTRPFTGIEYFMDWRAYVPYGLTLLVPYLVIQKR